MDSITVIKSLQDKGFLISPEALQRIMAATNPDELAELALKNAEGKLSIELADLEHREKTKIVAEEKPVLVEHTSFRPLAKDVESRVSVRDAGGDTHSLGGIDDFFKHFNDRYDQLKGMLMHRGHNPFTPINNLNNRKGQRVKLIVMLDEKKATKNGHVIFQLEDPTGTLTALVPKSNAPLIRATANLIQDQVMGVEGRISKDLFIVDDFFEPELPPRSVRTIDENICLAMTSDMHIGSKLFMKKNFEQFLEWLKGKKGDELQRELAGRIKYLTIAGDLVDGVGTYPGQEKELDISDIYAQYDTFSNYIEQIPDYIHIVICPGNHDAVKVADPAPPLPKTLVPRLYERGNVTLIGSPDLVELHGQKALMYHGTCFIDMINNMPGLSFDKGAKIMTEFLKKRHIHPYYGGKPITPTHHDKLVIREAPDYFHCGESHNNSYEVYNGTICVNSGTWQQISPYQQAQGHIVTPCILPIIDMHRGKIKVMHFDREIE